MDVFKRFPLVCKKILNRLDDQSLVRSKEASKEIAECLENGRFYWIRMMKKMSFGMTQMTKMKRGRYQGFDESWKEVIFKTPINYIKDLAIAVQYFYEQFFGSEKVAPLHVAVETGNFNLCQYIISKTSNKNPAGDYGMTPLHRATTNDY